jgi:hypothetical protein
VCFSVTSGGFAGGGAEKTPAGDSSINTLTVCDGFSRYPVELLVKTNLPWDQLMEAWYEKAATTPHWDAKKYPKVASAYEMRDVRNQPVTSMDGLERVFVYYVPTTTVAPPKPPPADSAAPKARKTTRTFMTAIPSRDAVELAQVACYDDAIPMAQAVGNIPKDLTITRCVH